MDSADEVRQWLRSLDDEEYEELKRFAAWYRVASPYQRAVLEQRLDQMAARRRPGEVIPFRPREGR
jgi:hypothetical protein